MTGIVQASYNLNHNAAFAGMVADGQAENIVSKLNSTVATIPYGKGVVRDGEFSVGTITTGTVATDFVGVAVRELNRSYNIGDDFGAVPNKDFSVMTMGAIWVYVRDEAVVPGNPVALIINAVNPGDFKTTAGALDAVTIPGAKFLTAANADGLAKVSFVVGG